MKKYLVLWIMFVLPSFFAAAQGDRLKSADKVADPDGLAYEYYAQLTGLPITTNSNLTLYQTVIDWYKTPYRYGGNSKYGIDCSGFATVLYETAYHKSLAASSGSIYQQCTPLTKDQLTEGDLVFFKIRGGRVSHVGVYLGDNKFAHASVHAGVIISNLNEPYYARTFFAGGVLNN